MLKTSQIWCPRIWHFKSVMSKKRGHDILQQKYFFILVWQVSIIAEVCKAIFSEKYFGLIFGMQIKFFIFSKKRDNYKGHFFDISAINNTEHRSNSTFFLYYRLPDNWKKCFYRLNLFRIIFSYIQLINHMRT